MIPRAPRMGALNRPRLLKAHTANAAPLTVVPQHPHGAAHQCCRRQRSCNINFEE